MKRTFYPKVKNTRTLQIIRHFSGIDISELAAQKYTHFTVVECAIVPLSNLYFQLIWLLKRTIKFHSFEVGFGFILIGFAAAAGSASSDQTAATAKSSAENWSIEHSVFVVLCCMLNTRAYIYWVDG